MVMPDPSRNSIPVPHRARQDPVSRSAQEANGITELSQSSDQARPGRHGCKPEAPRAVNMSGLSRRLAAEAIGSAISVGNRWRGCPLRTAPPCAGENARSAARKIDRGHVDGTHTHHRHRHFKAKIAPVPGVALASTNTDDMGIVETVRLGLPSTYHFQQTKD